MLSNKLKDAFRDIDSKDPSAHSRKALYSIFIDIATTLSEMREQKGLSQRELARRINTSHPTIIRWETPGYTGYTLSKLVDLAEELGCRLDVRFIPKEREQTTTRTQNVKDDSWEGSISEKVLIEYNIRSQQSSHNNVMEGV